MRAPDFSRTDRAGYSILYPETEAAEEWMYENGEGDNLSSGVEGDEDTLRSIREAGLRIEGDYE